MSDTGPLHDFVVRKTASRKVDKLVEDRIIFGRDKAELSLFQTFEPASQVSLSFDNPVIVTMIDGHKVMHFDGHQGMDFRPEQTFVLPSDTEMRIDFPTAALQRPTRCLTLCLSGELVQESVHLFQAPHAQHDQPPFEGFPFALLQDGAVQHTVQRLVYLFMENNQAAQGLFVDFVLKELVIRILQTQARHVLMRQHQQHAHHHRLSSVISYVEAHIHEELRIEKLCQVAGMSKSSFYRYFQQSFGLAPNEYVLMRKMEWAKKLLAKPDKNVSDVCFELGFNSLQYFNRAFRSHTGLAPSAYRRQVSSGKK